MAHALRSGEEIKNLVLEVTASPTRGADLPGCRVWKSSIISNVTGGFLRPKRSFLGGEGARTVRGGRRDEQHDKRLVFGVFASFSTQFCCASPLRHSNAYQWYVHLHHIPWSLYRRSTGVLAVVTFDKVQKRRRRHVCQLRSCRRSLSC